MAAIPVGVAPAQHPLRVSHFEDPLVLKVFACLPLLGDIYQGLDVKYNASIHAGESVAF